jgi:hypothetical protein
MARELSPVFHILVATSEQFTHRPQIARTDIRRRNTVCSQALRQLTGALVDVHFVLSNPSWVGSPASPRVILMLIHRNRLHIIRMRRHEFYARIPVSKLQDAVVFDQVIDLAKKNGNEFK